MSRRPLRSPSVLAAVTAAMVGATLVPSASATASATRPRPRPPLHGTAPAHAGTATRTASYTNPVSRGFADTFADPSLIRGQGRLLVRLRHLRPAAGGRGHAAPHPDRAVGRPGELDARGRRVHRRHAAVLGRAGRGLWAPDIRYVDGQYRMYYVVTETTVTGERDDNAIGMATAPTPAGPWTDSGAPVVGPRRGGQVGDGNFLWTFDPTAVTDTDGSQWLFYGSYYGGLCSPG